MSANNGTLHHLELGIPDLVRPAGSRAEVDRLVADATDHGWILRYPGGPLPAGGSGWYAGHPAIEDGYQVELVADPPRADAS